jgi:hypothetical protein
MLLDVADGEYDVRVVAFVGNRLLDLCGIGGHEPITSSQ